MTFGLRLSGSVGSIAPVPWFSRRVLDESVPPGVRSHPLLSACVDVHVNRHPPPVIARAWYRRKPTVLVEPLTLRDVDLLRMGPIPVGDADAHTRGSRVLPHP